MTSHSPVTGKPYMNDAVIGNASMLVALGYTGEIYRLWWPHPDIPQHVDRIRAGVSVQGKTNEIVWLTSENDWDYDQAYLEKTNVLKTTAVGKQLPLTVSSTDFVVPDKDLLVRHYEVTNTSSEALSVCFTHYASMTMSESRLYNTVMFDEQTDGLVYFRHRYAFALASANVCTGYSAGPEKKGNDAYLPNQKVNMTTEGSLTWDLQIAPGETLSLPIYIACGTSIDEALANMQEAKAANVDKWLDETITYWYNYLGELREKAPLHTSDNRIERVYDRSLLVFKLMSDKQTGSVIAAPEFDEAYTRCGGYAYCWGRDAAYITTAFDRAGLTSLTRDFYRWALIAQDRDGSWQQRHYHDGSLAPSWGIQIDEGGSILWGMYQHYLATQDRSFLDEVWTSVEKGATFLLSYLDQETGLPLPSRDLWEERDAEHTYSAAAVYGGILGAASIARELGKTDVADLWSAAALRLKEAIETECVNPDNNTFYRAVKLSVEKSVHATAQAAGKRIGKDVDAKGYETPYVWIDDIYDISLLGLSLPFEMLDTNDPRMVATADAIERTCTSDKVGGIIRYEDDHYIGGNPWILTTLWMAQFRIKQGRIDEAKKHLEWAVSHATSLSLLPEQIDKDTGETAWVVPLTWSHAMFVLTVHMLQDIGELV